MTQKRYTSCRTSLDSGRGISFSSQRCTAEDATAPSAYVVPPGPPLVALA